MGRGRWCESGQDNADHDEKLKMNAEAITSVAGVAMTHFCLALLCSVLCCLLNWYPPDLCQNLSRTEPNQFEPNRPSATAGKATNKTSRYFCQLQLTKKHGKQIRRQQQKGEANKLCWQQLSGFESKTPCARKQACSLLRSTVRFTSTHFKTWVALLLWA